MRKHTKKGLTIIEIIIAIAVLAIVVAAGVIAFNPAGQFAAARNSQRQMHLNALLNAIRQNMAENIGNQFSCASGSLPSSTKKMASSTGNYNIGPCLVPTYLPAMPFDPSASSSRYISTTDYDSGYAILQNASTGQITISAPSAELGKTINIIR